MVPPDPLGLLVKGDSLRIVLVHLEFLIQQVPHTFFLGVEGLLYVRVFQHLHLGRVFMEFGGLFYVLRFSIRIAELFLALANRVGRQHECVSSDADHVF